MCNAWCFDFADLMKRHIKSDVKVLEVGSFDVNGTLRTTLSPKSSEYIGVDLSEGPGVDIKMDVKHLNDNFASNAFDIVVSTEMIEHCYDWQSALYQMATVLSCDGLLLVTTRSPGFELHDYPADYWRFSLDDFMKVFSPLGEILAIQSDMTLGWECGIGVIVRKQISPEDLDAWYSEIKKISVYSMAQETADHNHNSLNLPEGE